jgi:hypothetical protein
MTTHWILTIVNSRPLLRDVESKHYQYENKNLTWALLMTQKIEKNSAVDSPQRHREH